MFKSLIICTLFLLVTVVSVVLTEAALHFHNNNQHHQGSSSNLKQEPVNINNLRTYSHALKGVKICPCQNCDGAGHCTNCTKDFKDFHDCTKATNFQAELMNLELPDSQRPPVSTLRQWWTTGDLEDFTFPNWKLRMYVDGETTPSISFRLFESHAMNTRFGYTGAEKQNWHSGSKLMKASLFAGLTSGIPVPFSKSLRITVEMTKLCYELGAGLGIYFMSRVLIGMPVTIGSSAIQLPPDARLRTTRTIGVQKPLSSVMFLNATNCSGLIYGLMLSTESTTPHYLEGKFSAKIDAQKPMLLSSGFEDYFLSAQYFDAGVYTSPLAGATHVDMSCWYPLPEKNGTKCRVSAFRFHDEDIVMWHDSMEYRWTVGDPFYEVHPTWIDGLVFSYEWN